MLEHNQKRGGWLVQVTSCGVAGIPAIQRLYYVYEPDELRAHSLIRAHLRIAPSETCTLIAPIDVETLSGIGITPGDVKPAEQ
jgi:hypothetical protein